MSEDNSERPLPNDPDESSPQGADAEAGDEPIRGGRRLGDDPFLTDEGFFWWLPRTFSLLVVAVALMLLGAHFFGGEDPGEPQRSSASVVPAPSPAASPAAASQSQQPAAPLRQPGIAEPSNRLDRGRTYNARRRLVLQEAELLMATLPAEGRGSPEEDRDRRVLRDFVRRMDTPAR